MGSPLLWFGSSAKFLKGILDINGSAQIHSGAVDPTSVATSAPKGSLYLNTSTGLTYRKTDAGSSTNWTALGTATVITVDRFSGDASTVAFTLSQTPASEDNTWVYVSGVYQQKDTYSLAGAVVTFSSAPPSGSGNIEIVTGVSGGANGNVTGPGSATDSAVVLFDGTTGKLIKDSAATISGIRDRSTHTGTEVVTSSSSSALAVGANGTTNPALRVDASTASSATGLLISSAAAGGGLLVSAISSGASESITLSSKSTGNAALAAAGAGQVILSTNSVTRVAVDDVSFSLTPTAGNTASTARFVFTGAADAALTAGAESPSVYLNSGQIRTHASNTAITLQRDQRITPSTHAFSSSGGVITNAAALAIDGPPIGGTNSTLTNSSALYIPTSALTNTTNGYGANIAATTGATNNYAAVFNGGNVGIGTSAPTNVLSVSASTGITSGTHIAATINTNLSPNSGSSSDFRGTVLSTMTTTAQTYSGAMSGSWHETRMNSAGSVASSSGIRSFGMVFGSAAVNFTALTQAQAILTQGISSFSNTATGTITAASGMRAINSVLNNQTLTGQAGIIVEPLTAATNNSAMVIGSTSIPTGNFGIYNASTNNNYFNGNVGIKITAPAASIHTDAGTATASNHKFTAGTTTGQTSSDGVDFGIDASGNGIINQREALDIICLTSNAEALRIKAAGNIVLPTTVTAGGTTGAQTINKTSGTVNFAATATSLVVTNSLVTTTSIVLAIVRTNDATAIVKNVVPSAGSFAINLNAAATAETSVGFVVIN